MEGSEVLIDTNGELSDALISTMQIIHAALVLLNLADKIKVSTPYNMAILESSIPPSTTTSTLGEEPEHAMKRKKHESRGGSRRGTIEKIRPINSFK